MIVFEKVTKKFFVKGMGIKYIFRELNLTIPRLNIAILGNNGVGKSTLISLIAGSVVPNSGRVVRQCQVSWPLGLRSGFQGSLTGRENVLFVCRVYGCSFHAAKKKVEFVEDFAELGNYFNMPVKTYSSGMMAKLGFGLSMAFDFDMYLVDEVIAVGDSSFRKKSIQLFEEKRNKANVIFISHDVSTIRLWCSAAIYLEEGTCQFYENIDEAITRYQRS